MYIYSKWSEKDMLQLNVTNSVADLYELLGIYDCYCNDHLKCSFKKFYEETVNTRPYHFRNVGEKKLKSILQQKGIAVSRKEIRLLSRTYLNIPVIASSTMGIIFSELTNQICKDMKMQRMLHKLPLKFTPNDFLYFQYYLVSKYVRVRGYANSYKKAQAFRKVLNDWEMNCIFA